ncbi:MAG: hypothetical protein ACU0BB_04745 [Paracoccaceae bacterium]
MKMSTKLCALFPAALLALPMATATPALSETIDWKTVGGWDISFYPGSEGCQAFALFEEDTAFFIGFDSTGGELSLDVTLMDERWGSIDAGEDYSITVKFGDESPWTLDMAGVQIDEFPGLNILIDSSSDQADLFVDEFQRETSMTWSFSGSQLGRYTLRGSRRAFDEVIACQRSYFEALENSSDPFSNSDDPFSK